MKAICIVAAQIRDRGFKRSDTSANISKNRSISKATVRADRVATIDETAINERLMCVKPISVRKSAGRGRDFDRSTVDGIALNKVREILVCYISADDYRIVLKEVRLH